MKTLIDFIKERVNIDSALEQKLNEIQTEDIAEKGATISNQNTYCRHLFFIKKGLVKFCFKTSDAEFIMRFFAEGILFTDLEGWHRKEPTDYEIVTLERTEFVKIPFSKFEQLTAEHHALESFYRQMMTMASLNMMDRIKIMLEKDATKRYANFVGTHPHLLQRISLGDLSKYLGITQVSLSRIRATK